MLLLYTNFLHKSSIEWDLIGYGVQRGREQKEVLCINLFNLFDILCIDIDEIPTILWSTTSQSLAYLKFKQPVELQLPATNHHAKFPSNYSVAGLSYWQIPNLHFHTVICAAERVPKLHPVKCIFYFHTLDEYCKSQAICFGLKETSFSGSNP